MRLLVTGGCGFIGSNFIRYVLTEHPDDRVVNLDKLTYAGNPANLAEFEADARYRFVQGDIADADVVRDVIQGVDAVVNFAAPSHVDRSILDADEFLKTNVLGVRVLLDAVRALRIPRLLHISTDEVYGSIAKGAATEASPLRPSNPYSAAKAGGDLLALAYWNTHRVPVVITRSSNNFGPYQYPEKMIPLFITNALDDQRLPLYGDGQQVRDWLYVRDHCEALLLVLEKGRKGEVYNIGGNNEMTNLALVRRVLQELRKPESLITYVKDRPGHDRRYAIDASKIRSELGWSPRFTFETGLPLTIRWYRTETEWLQRVRSGAYRDYYARQYGGET